EAGEDFEAKWRREYPSASAELERTAQEFLAKGTVSFRFLNGETITTSELTVASSGDKKLIVLDKRTIEPPNRPCKAANVLCHTPKHAFSLKKESSGEPYTLERLEAKGRDGEFNYAYDMYARSATVYMQKTLLERMRSPSFVLKLVKGMQEGED